MWTHVDTGPLLHHLQRSTQDGSSQVGAWVAEATREAVRPRVNVRRGGDEGRLVLVVGDDLGQLLLNILGVLGLASDTGQRAGRVFDAATLDEPTRRLGQDDQTGTENQRPKELNTDGDSVRASVVAVLRGVHDAVGQQDTDGDAELVARDDRASDLSGRDLGHVENDDRGDEADTDTRDDTTGNHETDGGARVRTGGSLEDAADAENDTTANDRDSTPEVVGNVAGGKGTEEGTSRQDRREQRGLGSGDDNVVGRVRALTSGGNSLVRRVVDQGDEILHAENATHPPSVIAASLSSTQTAGGCTYPKKMPPKQANTQMK